MYPENIRFLQNERQQWQVAPRSATGTYQIIFIGGFSFKLRFGWKVYDKHHALLQLNIGMIGTLSVNVLFLFTLTTNFNEFRDQLFQIVS